MNKFDELIRRDDVWFQAAVAVAVLVFLGVMIGTLVAFLAGEPDAVHVGARIDIVYKLGLIGAGLITFCTVGWRGLIATQQARLQQVQIEKLTAQIAATDENNLAALLQKGAELISAGKPGEISAGIATLQAVATDRNPKFAKEAMDILADYIQTSYPESNSPHVAACADALESAALMDRTSDRRLEFSTTDRHHWWTLFSGVRLTAYQGGRISGLYLEEKGKEEKFRAVFDKTRIFAGILAVDGRFSMCHFDQTIVESMTYGYDNTFTDCDFSDAVIQIGDRDLPFDATAGNWYKRGRPPTAVDGALNLSVFAAPPKGKT